MQTSFLEGRAGYEFLKERVSVHYFIFILLTDNINSQIYKVKQFIENLAALKYSMSTERRLDRTEQLFFSLLYFVI